MNHQRATGSGRGSTGLTAVNHFSSGGCGSVLGSTMPAGVMPGMTLRDRPVPDEPARGRARSALLALLGACLLLATLAGCEGSQSVRGLDQAIADYEAGRLSTAYETASEIARAGEGRRSEQAAYVAGLTAYRMGRQTEAERYLLASARSGDSTTAGNARATLGLLRLDQNRPSEAAQLFRDANGTLSGSDARKAAQFAAASYEQAGDHASARSWSMTASRADAGSTASVETLTSGSTFAIQIGAFQDRRRAERAAAEVRSIVDRAGYGAIRIIARTDHRSRQLYVVQFGQFRTRNEAASARARLGKLEYIVAPAS